MWRMLPVESMPMVVDQAVPSLVQSTVGSEWKESPVTSGRLVWPQVPPPSEEKYCACWPLPPMLFEALMIFSGLRKLIRMSDSLRDTVWAPEMRRLTPADVFMGETSGSRRPGWRLGWASIHSATSLSTSG